MSDPLATDPLPSRVTPPPIRKPGRPAKRTNRPPIGLTTKVEAALNKLIFDAMTRPEAAKAVGLADGSLRLALRNPEVMTRYRELLEVLRLSERPRAIHRVVQLRDHADSERVKLDAAKHLDVGDRQPGNVQVNVGVGVNVQPGYQVVLPEMADTQILKLAGSTANVLDDKGDVSE